MRGAPCARRWVHGAMRPTAGCTKGAPRAASVEEGHDLVRHLVRVWARVRARVRVRARARARVRVSVRARARVRTP